MADDQGPTKATPKQAVDEAKPVAKPVTPAGAPVPEIGGAPGPDPTRYGDWQHRGRVSDF